MGQITLEQSTKYELTQISLRLTPGFPSPAEVIETPTEGNLFGRPKPLQAGMRHQVNGDSREYRDRDTAGPSNVKESKLSISRPRSGTPLRALIPGRSYRLMGESVGEKASGKSWMFTWAHNYAMRIKAHRPICFKTGKPPVGTR